nr:MAG TPA: hypothetical protein [Caudoviricetes sp.]DAX30724.1 MAG TPA: hypothetical protein [Caudoviricetes sp.]
MPEVVSLNGLSEIEGFLSRLRDAPSPERLREPFFRAAEVYQQDVRSTLPALYKQPNRNGHIPRGNLIRGLRRRMPRRSRGGRISLSIGFYYVNGRGAYDQMQAANHAHLIDQGTGDRYTKDGKFRGRVLANYFWTHARQRQRQRAQQILLRGVTHSLSSI